MLEILVNPPIWRTWVAYLFYALGIISIVFAVERARAHRLKLSTELSLKRLESRKLAELDQLKTRFFTDITHEFRTPLTLIQGSLERLPQRFEQVPRDLERIQENTNRLTSLIDQILDLARVEAGKMVFAPAVHDLADFTRFVVSCFSSLAESGGVELTCKSPDEPVLVSFDSDQLEKCLSNLLTNALKFTPSEGTVTVHLRQDSQNGRAFPNGYAELKVEDTGVGIPEDQLERVFDRFYQAGKTKEGHRQVSGVGLALTRELVRLHGGEIWADSGELKGSSFTIRLPLVTVDVTLGEPFQTTRDNPTATYAAKPIEAPTSTTSDSRTGEELPEVLVVDDHPDIRRLLQDALEPDHIARSAANGNKAFEQALAAPPDLIVSDVMMPDLDGYQLCRHLRKDRRTSHIPIIMLTAKAGRQDRIEGLQTGADAYLTKPFSREELLTRVRNLIKQREQLREKYPRRIQLDPKDISITSTDELFLRRVMQIVEEQLSAFDFSVAKLASHVGLSRVQLHRKIRALTGESPTDFIRTTRLRLAARLLARGGFNVTQAAYEVGFQNLSYFAKCFRDRFGVSPSEYAKNPFEEVQG